MRPLALRSLTYLLLAAAGCGGRGDRASADSSSAIAADLRRAAAADAPADSGAGPDSSGTSGEWVISATGVPRRLPTGAGTASPAATAPLTVPPPASTVAPATSAAPLAAPTAASNSASLDSIAGSSWCASPRAADQRRCLGVYLAVEDARLNTTYQSLIAALVRRDGAGAAGREPASVRALRASQRAWLGARDAECRALGRGTEGALWAPPRARCLGARADLRADSLAAQLRSLDSARSR